MSTLLCPSGWTRSEFLTALSAAGLLRPGLLDRAIAAQAMEIAAGICIYTNSTITLETL